ncbi:hypothetical protein [Sphingobacterium daejeonense]|uniref:hypothetical protein n=1 Tax=Sphingobacterium daejeonense TaxID=371142 RepID=UPI0010C5A6E2|nr:hypothetical protein [Sphingobacterium daejeonense]VTP92586.1 Uncharacterised protein [Sphingobacterium daejeonense]
MNGLRLGKAFSAILAVIVAIAVIAGLSWFIVYESILIGKDASAITDKVLSVFEGGQKWLETQFGIERTEVMEKLREQGEKAMGNAGGMLSSTFGFYRKYFGECHFSSFAKFLFTVLP